ncbi:hypothetical protein BU26DRAFT_259718 [Trematosphaeria pertusa]|uniref:Uncharacterized protein n=1 Tax=Trematosphaeria pertusa TaxID=390896 RepID=A0A6A6IR91_9PLEO|nr:uncharacterized protein BU26DRAFT_259718 [Trematosphaeria pertusa]KAF2252598.1 hypothetical protein BU26DRAFT_259718 [Trematosphaeria pertusa]
MARYSRHGWIRLAQLGYTRLFHTSPVSYPPRNSPKGISRLSSAIRLLSSPTGTVTYALRKSATTRKFLRILSLISDTAHSSATFRLTSLLIILFSPGLEDQISLGSDLELSLARSPFDREFTPERRHQIQQPGRKKTQNDISDQKTRKRF